ncbi:MAG: ABC-F family ATP-binding cassette domain-containing protein [Candidatus Sungbacteria bacterium]|nr:ABC-F family ATP-binding cassette domain-containing protein [Candidatus Sungbacteria bacterium]
MSRNDTLVRFDEVTFEYGPKKPILEEASFPVREGSKIALMGQNGAGKTTIFQLITGSLKPESGEIHRANDLTIAVSRQVIPREQMLLTVREFFSACFPKKVYDIDPRIDAVLEVVHLAVGPGQNQGKIYDRVISSFSGGQQARLLLASALIQNPDLLLLDEPTNNLDKQGIEHLTKFLIEYPKTCMVISHDADFLNSFTHGVLYLDVFTRKVEQYVGNYFDVVKEITARIAKEQRENSRLLKTIQEKKDQSNKFAKKGGQMRLVATRMREKAAELEEEMVDVRKEDKTIRPFAIPVQQELSGELVHISSVTGMRNHQPVARDVNVSLRKNEHLLLAGPNGIGKSTFLESLVTGAAPGVVIAPGVKIGYYRQDFSTLHFGDTVIESLKAVMDAKDDEQHMRSVAAGFLITGELMGVKIGHLSEGQKGLVAFARLVLERPGLLILDEPTNHINFRHLPVIAKALDSYQGAMILVSHVPEFVSQIRIDTVLDMEKGY